ncbi:rab GTPase-activating protein 1-like [Ascaphus truei]|uniref:rab GTPase-activating protein 1-like n=1 Tax=Ascaphus truei TaxID=8439 RepID=UPI003F5A19DC
MTTAVDLVITEVQEPVRFLLETKVRVCSPNERLFWPFSKRSSTENFFLKLKQIERKERKSNCDTFYEVLCLESESERERRKTTASPSVRLSQCGSQGSNIPSPPEDDEEEGKEVNVGTWLTLVRRSCRSGSFCWGVYRWIKAAGSRAISSVMSQRRFVCGSRMQSGPRATYRSPRGTCIFVAFVSAQTGPRQCAITAAPLLHYNLHVWNWHRRVTLY